MFGDVVARPQCFSRVEAERLLGVDTATLNDLMLSNVVHVTETVSGNQLSIRSRCRLFECRYRLLMGSSWRQ